MALHGEEGWDVSLICKFLCLAAVPLILNSCEDRLFLHLNPSWETKAGILGLSEINIEYLHFSALLSCTYDAVLKKSKELLEVLAHFCKSLKAISALTTARREAEVPDSDDRVTCINRDNFGCIFPVYYILQQKPLCSGDCGTCKNQTKKLTTFNSATTATLAQLVTSEPGFLVRQNCSMCQICSP